MNSATSRHFTGAEAETVEPFLEQIQHHIVAQDRQRDNIWVADYVSTLLKGRALVWFYTLDEETQSSWKKLRLALVSAFSVHTIATLEGSPSLVSSLSPPPEYTPKDARSETDHQSPSPRPRSLMAPSIGAQSVGSTAEALPCVTLLL